jgi:hypothetical protein
MYLRNTDEYLKKDFNGIHVEIGIFFGGMRIESFYLIKVNMRNDGQKFKEDIEIQNMKSCINFQSFLNLRNLFKSSLKLFKAFLS